jgi:hypothetical protein
MTKILILVAATPRRAGSTQVLQRGAHVAPPNGVVLAATGGAAIVVELANLVPIRCGATHIRVLDDGVIDSAPPERRGECLALLDRAQHARADLLRVSRIALL